MIRRPRLVALGLLGCMVRAVAAMPASAGDGPTVEPVATGLDNPRGLSVGSGGLLVAEAGGVPDPSDCITDPEFGTVCLSETGAVSRVALPGGAVNWRNEIFEPLGLADMRVLLDESALARTAAVHRRREDGSWGATDIDYYAPGSGPPEFFAGGHCLYATAGDHLRFQRALLARGTLDGAAILGERTLAEMFSEHLAPIRIRPFPAAQPFVTVPVDLGPGVSWSLGQCLTTERRPGLRHAGSGGWIGLFNTAYWIDPDSGITGGFFTSTLPFYDGPVVDAMQDFERACYEGLAL